MATNFPLTSDTFPILQSTGILDADTGNNYGDAIIACEVTLESVYTQTQTSQQTLLAATFLVRTQTDLYNPDGWQQLNQTTFKRHNGTNHRPYRPSGPQNLLVPLNLSTFTSGDFPNGNPFAAGNAVFVTCEVQGQAYTTDYQWDVLELDSESDNKGGGAWMREGALYYNGASDLNPEIVIADFFPCISGHGNGSDNLYDMVYTVLVHLVIIG